MRINTRKIIAFLAFVLLLILSCACSDDIDSPDVTNDISSSVTEAPERELVLFSGGETDYVLIRPDKVKDTSIYTDFRNALREASGSQISLDIDAFYKGHEYDAERAEILCGTVNYPETEGANKGLAFDEYKICIVGNKIVISGRTEKGLIAGFDAFCDYVSANIKEGSLTVKDSLLLVGEASYVGYSLLLDSIPAVYDGYESVALSYCGDGYQQATLSGASAETFFDYCATLESDGFSLYAENKMADTSYMTYSKGEINLHTYYTPHNSEMRIIASKGTLLPWKDGVTYTKVCEPTVTLMGLAKGGSDGGLGMILGLEDGSFIVIDGGNNTKAEADDLANTLISLSPDKNNVIIRAWFITHAHSDHYGAFRKFSDIYARTGKFTIERFIYNFCDAESQRVWGGCSYDTVLNTMKNAWKEAVHYKALTGEVYRFPGCDIEILYCMSDFIPQIIGEEKGISGIDKENTDNNIESVVFRAHIGTQTVLITGDTSKVCVDEICDRYGSYLKSDILQVPHHGHNRNSYRARNGTVEFYRLTDPVTVLWPASASSYDSMLDWNGQSGANYEANYYLVYKLNVKEVIVAASTTRTITLPYEK